MDDLLPDHKAVELLELMATYFELYGPEGTEDQGDAPEDLSSQALASDLFMSLESVASSTQARLRERLAAVGLVA